ncbi:Ig-like domain-containing protein [Aureisphaera galaxeae]|uniref:Ig-like domain-containing protein n=1 Tax=Aureisphaera galaxeae TaxID=1538023 RepID=UPI00234FE260|nr:Ig-like domain-containing protein [Aureisphaera galaxeae]MDC8002637.1 Ig-like domain-containing protein [Aureisphaera galaxeae]
MNRQLLHFLLVFGCILLFSQCAKRGTPSGGPKDSIPPVIIKSNPENYSTLYEGDEIRIYFDEYIKLKDLQSNLIVSPPFTNQPVITPLSTSKVLKIQIQDTLKENTTYSFNFGKSIVDNNEDNSFDYYKYVFSTGDFIDSLTVEGTIKDALLLKSKDPVTVMLYERNEAFTDSIVYLEKPTYITTTRDSTYAYKLTNIKEGNFLLVALQESVNDYIFQPKTDKIGFIEGVVSTPTDSSFQIKMFKEVLEYRMARPNYPSKQRIIFGYEGNVDSLKLTPLFDLPEGYEYKTYWESATDTLNYFFKPPFEFETTTDTLQFLAQNREQLDTLTVVMKDLYLDTLKISKVSPGTVIPRDSIKLKGNNPLVALDTEKITVMDKDSMQIPVTTYIDERYNVASLIFEKQVDQLYSVQILPEAFTDFYGNKSLDTLAYNFRTQTEADYGTITFTLQNAKKFPIIVELVDSKYKLIRSNYITSAEDAPSFFDFLEPDNYYIRIIYDENENGSWDTGNYLMKVQPEEVAYYPKPIEVRANWSLPETFILD